MFWRKDPWLGHVLPSLPERRLTKLLGRTKLCSVYLAERVNQPVGDSLTIKIYAREREGERRRDQPEIEYLATSEGICLDQCLNAEVNDGSWLLTFGRPEFVPLTHLLARAPQDFFTTASVVEQTARALSGVHARHLVHRKVDASSVRFTPDLMSLRPIVQLADFSNAMFTAGPHASLTPHLQRVDSNYAPPEQRAGADIETSADVYALARIACDLRANRKARSGKRDAPTSSDAWTGMPQRFAEVLRAALSTWPSARPTAREIYDVASVVRRDCEPTLARVYAMMSTGDEAN